MENMKNVKFVISIVVPVPAAAMLGGSNLGKDLSKLDRERRYFLNALVRRGATVISHEEVKAEVPAAEQPKDGAKAAPAKAK